MGDFLPSDYLHWYAFSFIGNPGEGLANSTACGSVYIGYVDRRITVPRIREAQEQSGIPGGTLIAVSYLGCMPRTEFTPDEPHQGRGGGDA